MRTQIANSSKLKQKQKQKQDKGEIPLAGGGSVY